MKNFTISELVDRGRCQKTIPPSSVRYEDQVEVRLPLSKFWVENFEVEMQENRDRSRGCFISKPREASPERLTRRMDRGAAASTPQLLDPTEAHWDGRT